MHLKSLVVSALFGAGSLAAVLPRDDLIKIDFLPQAMAPLDPAFNDKMRRPLRPKVVKLAMTDLRLLGTQNLTSLEPVVPAQQVTAIASEVLAPRQSGAGPDPRRIYNGTDYPFLAMGRLQWSNGVVCSASLVGPRHILTARHCMGEASTSYRFQPLYNNGERFAGAWVQAVIALAELPASICGNKEDWAVMVLDRRMDGTHGYLGFRALDAGVAGRRIFWNYGHPGAIGNTLVPVVQDGFSLNEQADGFGCANRGPAYTSLPEARFTGGNSGGPLWVDQDGGPYVVAVASAIDAQRGYHAHGQNMLEAIRRARADYP